MLTRRKLFNSLAISLLHPLIAKPLLPSGKRCHIAQSAHLTVNIPSHWSLTPPLPQPGGPQMIGSTDGFFAASPSIEAPTKSTLAKLWDANATQINETAFTWRGMRGVQFDFNCAFGDVMALAIANPHPILTFGGPTEYLVLTGDADHFAEIRDSITFGLDGVTAAYIAKSITDIICTHSIFRGQIDWNALYAKAARIDAVHDIDEYLQLELLSSLLEAGDNHSSILDLRNLTDLGTTATNIQPSHYPTGHVIDGYGYLAFPGTSSYTSDYYREYARTAAAMRNQHIENGVKGWIIDLRNMRGGNVSPLLTALLPFLPDGRVAGFMNAYGHEHWVEKDGKTIIPATYLQDTAGEDWPSGLSDPSIPMAVLIGPNTASAGEFVLLALTSRDNTQTFGLNTAGYTTANTGVLLFNDHQMSLATAAEIDIHGNRYMDEIEPHVVDSSIGRGVGVSREEIAAALDWLEATIHLV